MFDASAEELKNLQDRLEKVNAELAREITERKQAEEALSRREAYFRFLNENSSDVITVINADGIIRYESPSVERLLGYNPSELIGQSVFDFIYPDDLPVIMDVFTRDVHRPGAVLSMKYRMRHKDGSWCIMEMFAHNLLQNEAVRGIVVNSHDITTRITAENDLRGERNQLQTMLNFYRRAEMRLYDIEDFIIEECVRISESPLGFFGFINEDETLMKTHLWSEQAMEGCAVDFKPVEFSLDHAGIWAEAVRKHEPVIINDYLKPDPRKKGYPEGHVPIQRLMSIPIIKGDKAVAIAAVANKKLDYNETDLLHLSLFIESMWDVLERKNAEEEICKLNEELEQKVEARTKQLISVQEELVRKEKLSVLGQLAGVVGHEIRNPLGVMSNAVYFLKTVMPDADDMVKEYLDIIKQEIDNSQRIITDLLDFARTKTPQIVPVAVNVLVTQALGKCTIPENIAVQTDIPDILPQANADPFQINQVLQNLIINAVQAMPNGGALHISACPVSSVKIQVLSSDLAPDTDFVEIIVADTGEGISSENMEKLFQPLFTTKTKGIGLGLVVCKNLIEANGGGIEAVSKSGEGATFTFTLPFEKRRG